MRKIKVLILAAVISFFAGSQLYAYPDVEEFVLEDGMHTYILEDYSSALVRVELAVGAGFSAQSPDNAGFFPLYSKLFKYASPRYRDELESIEAECNSDAARYVIYVTPDELRTALKAMSEACFEPIFQDADILRELTEAKKNVSEYAFSVEGFINASIDSRVFSAGPWKHDSGIYPTLFSKTNPSSCRLILSSISEKFYIPKNCILLISGPVEKEKVLKLAENTFGKSSKYGSAVFSPVEETDYDENKQKLFVLSDPEFSPDMTQIVVQYQNLEMEECDLAAAVLDDQTSLFKTKLLSDSSLGIRAPQYINAAAAHQNNSSRLIIQSLMENAKTSPCDNALKFIETVKDGVEGISEADFDNGKLLLINSFYQMLSDSSRIMELLSQFWAVKYSSSIFFYDNDQLSNVFFNRPERIALTSGANIKRLINEEDPYVFVLVNSTVLKKYARQFERSGFEIVTAKNGSWYTQKLYEEIKKSLENRSVVDDRSHNDIEDLSNNSFAEKNDKSMLNFSLVNNIPVYIKENAGNSTVSFCLVIDGGEIADDKKNYGLESVIVNSVAMKVRACLYQKYMDQKIRNFPEVKSQTDLVSSAIYVECLASDLNEIIEAFSDALIFSDFIPAMVDSVVLQRKSDQIVKTSSPVYQLYSNGISILFKNKEFVNSHMLEKDILKKIEFTQILESSTKLFNASRYKIIIAGNIEETGFSSDTIKTILDEHFGMIAKGKKIEKPSPVMNAVARRNKKIRLVHLFLTDVSKEKAGPRPQVLIPTTEFLDPAQYWITNNAASKNEAVFNAVLNDFAVMLQSECDKINQVQKMIVMTQAADCYLNCGTITFLNVKNSSTIESIYQKVFDEYKEDFGIEHVKRIKNNWIKKYMSQIHTNTQTSLSIKSGLDSASEDPEKYIKDYSLVMNSTPEDFKACLEDFNFDSILRLYSNDTKR